MPHTELRAEGACLAVAGDALRDVRIWGHRALDAIYVAARDEEWGTYPADVRLMSLTHRPGGVTAILRGEHGGDDPVFAWEGVVDVDVAAVRFTMRGRVLRDLSSQRIGVCLLHPLDLVGRDFQTETDTGTFSAAVNPRPPASGFNSLRYDAGCPIDIVLDGPPFEMEDHRNWSDPGWKSYCPPLGDPSPRRFHAGEEIIQAVTVRGTANVVPAIGGFAADQGAYRHVDLVEGAPWPTLPADVPLSIGLIRESPGWLDEAAARIAGHGRTAEYGPAGHGRIERVSVFDRGSSTTRPGDAGRVRAVLRELGCGAPVGGGSRAHLAELNRLDAPTDDWDFCTFPVTAQAHHSDTDSIMATVRAQPYAIEQARRVAPGMPVVVGPLAFRARAGANSPAAPDDPVDPRESDPLSAAWLLASVIALRRAEALTVLLDPAAPTTAILRRLRTLAGRRLDVLDTGRDHLLAATVVVDPPLTLVANLGPEPAGFDRGSTHALVPGRTAAVLDT
ncbi:hypothetical protein GCM10023322_35840 [Rugosimonospora acidiphila]|uniref:Uncharacterized protein n=1 Tax=Rugosimonospora acidiphila TaxID=556531 RepID=A0ABP9RUH9_9ACTN